MSLPSLRNLANFERPLVVLAMTLTLGLVLGTSPAAYAQTVESSREATPTTQQRKTTRGSRLPKTLQGLPKRRTGAATRGLEDAELDFIVMAPEDTPWLSLSDAPSLLVYVGENRPSDLIEVVITQSTEDETIVYDKLLTVPAEAGFFKIELNQPLNGTSFNTQEDYIWHVALVVDENNRSKDIYQQGKLNRTSAVSFMDAADAQQLVSASPLQRAQHLQQAGLWQEAAIALYDILQDANVPNAQRTLAQKNWAGLMQSLELEGLAHQPLPSQPLGEAISLFQTQ